MTKAIRVKLHYGPLSDKDVATQGVAVVDGMTNNPTLVNPPIKPADLKRHARPYAAATAQRSAIVQGRERSEQRSGGPAR